MFQAEQMMVLRWWRPALAAGLGVLLAGCKPQPIPPAPPSIPAPAQSAQGQPQPKLPTLKVWLGQQELATEIARTPDQMEMGMMFRTKMEENEAMLFVHPYPVQAKFWMRNTFLPLSCAYINNEGAILEIHDMKPRDETGIEAASNNIRYVLETRQGWFDRHQVTTGTVVRTERGSLHETFFGGR